MPGAMIRWIRAPLAHWLVAFSLPFCGSATAYEGQTLAAFGEKEHRAAIAVEALSLFSCRALTRRKASTHKGSTADSTPKASTHKGSTADSRLRALRIRALRPILRRRALRIRALRIRALRKRRLRKRPLRIRRLRKGALRIRRSTADSSFYSTGCWHLYFLLVWVAPTGLPTVVPVIALRAWFRLGTKASRQSRLSIKSRQTVFQPCQVFFGRDPAITLWWEYAFQRMRLVSYDGARSKIASIALAQSGAERKGLEVTFYDRTDRLVADRASTARRR